jgi:hypothetical protein
MTKSIVDKVKNKSLIPIWQGFGQSTPSRPEKTKGFLQQARAALRGIAI